MYVCMRKTQFAPGEYYHIYNRGNNKQNIFIDERDYSRLLFLILFLQAPFPIYNISRSVSHFIRYKIFNITEKLIARLLKERMVELVNFTFMPNHFHLLISENIEGGISQYMQRIQDAFTKYFNAKYSKVGHLFQGPFQAVHISTNEQLLHLSAYIHRNQRELKQWKNKEHNYLWSSYYDYVKENRWGDLLKTDIILEQFSNPEDFQNFVKTSGVKDLPDEKFLID